VKQEIQSGKLKANQNDFIEWMACDVVKSDSSVLNTSNSL